MKRLNQALLALLWACGINAQGHDRKECLGALDGALQAQVITEVVIWVNEDGDLIRTETKRVAATPTLQESTRPVVAFTTPSPANPNPTADTWAEIPAILQQQPTLTKKPLSLERLQQNPRPPAHQHQPIQLPRPDDNEKSRRQFGISYSPYNADRSCKTQAEVTKDLDKLWEYAFVRIYGTDCDQTTTVANAARHHHMQVFAGVYDLKNFPESLKAFNDAATLPDGRKDWSVFHTISIGNELVNGGMAQPADVIKAVHEARTMLRQEGYDGPVVTVDTFSVLLKHPELCHASDYCAANCHAFFDSTQHSQDAGRYVLEQAQAVSAAAGGKRTMITESGWPHAGQSNGAAVPSPENQRVAIESLRHSFAHREGDLVLFTAYDDLWKQDNRYTFNAERFWGMYQR